MTPEVPTVPVTPKKRNERTEAKFFEDVDKLIAEAERLGTEYNPPNEIAKLANLKAKRAAALAQRTVNQATTAEEETARNLRENAYKSLRADVRSLVDYAKASGKSPNDIDALNSIAREIGGGRAKPVEGGGEGGNISVAHLSYASRADNYSRFIEQYASLGIETTEDMYKAETHRTKLAAMRQANADVIAAKSAADTSGESLDKLAYTDADSLLNGCVSAKAYIKSKYKASGEPYKNIAKTRFDLPTRLR
jgi:hypothetical protein